MGLHVLTCARPRPAHRTEGPTWQKPCCPVAPRWAAQTRSPTPVAQRQDPRPTPEGDRKAALRLGSSSQSPRATQPCTVVRGWPAMGAAGKCSRDPILPCSLARGTDAGCLPRRNAPDGRCRTEPPVRLCREVRCADAPSAGASSGHRAGSGCQKALRSGRGCPAPAPCCTRICSQARQVVRRGPLQTVRVLATHPHAGTKGLGLQHQASRPRPGQPR